MSTAKVLKVLDNKKLLMSQDGSSIHAYTTHQQIMQQMIITAKLGKNARCFMSASQISKRKDIKGATSCPDLYAIVNCTKNSKVLNNMFKGLKVHTMSRSCADQGELNEQRLGEFIFNSDEDPNNNEVTLKHTN